MPEVAERLTQFFPAVWKALSPADRGKGSFTTLVLVEILHGLFQPVPVLQIRKGNGYKLGIFFHKNIFCAPSLEQSL